MAVSSVSYCLTLPTGQARLVIYPSPRHSYRHGTVHVEKRENAIVNRLNKTKDEREVNHEQERVDRLKKENAVKRVAAAEKVRLIPSCRRSLNR